MTNGQIEQAVRKVVGQDANPRKVQALMWAVERYGLEWLKTYQQRQQSEASKARQYTSRQRSTLDWADVEAWVKRQPQTSENWAVGGYYTACPVPTHKTDDLISVWAGNKDRGPGLKCWGGCRYDDIHEALTAAIKTSAPPVTDPQAAADARIKELEEALAAANDRASQSGRERAALENSNEKLQGELETLRGENGDLANELDTKAKEVAELREEQSSLENSLSAVTDRRDQLKRDRDSANRKVSRREKKISNLQNDVQKLQEEKASLETQLTAASKATQETTNNDPERATLEGRVRKLEREKSRLEKDLAAAKDESDLLLEDAEEERDRERTARTNAENRVRKLEGEKASLARRLTAAESEHDQKRAVRRAARAALDLEKQPAAASNVRQGVRAPNTLQMDGPLSNSRRLLSKDEPTYAFIDAMSVLELDLRRALERETVLDDDGIQCMLMTACQDIELISEKQWGRLDGMRWQRNQVLHHRRHQLKMPEAREAVDYLESTIGQLGA